MPSPSASPSPQVLEWQRNPSIKHADSIDVELASLDNNASHHKLDQQKRRRKCMLVACGLLFVAAAIGVAIAVASSVTSSKPLVVPERFSASFTASSGSSDGTPDLSGSLRKTLNSDGSWNLSGVAFITSHGQQTRVTLVNNAAYLETVNITTGAVRGQGCLQQINLPAFGSLQHTLGDSSPMKAGEPLSSTVPGCADGAAQQYSALYEDQPYVVCQNSDGSFTVQGASMKADLFNVQTSNGGGVVLGHHMVPTNVTSGQPMQCPQLSLEPHSSAQRLLDEEPLVYTSSPWSGYQYPPPPPAPTDSSGRRLLSDAAAAAADRQLLTQSAPPPDYHTTFFPPGSPPPNLHLGSVEGDQSCIFVHGAGVERDAAIGESFSSYWGNVHEKLEHRCTSFTFLHMNTYSRAWDDSALTTKFCQAYADDKQPTTLIFSHGSGTLTVAKAFESGACTRRKNTFWIDLQAQYHAEQLGYFANDWCPTYTRKPSGSDPIGDELQNDMHLCDKSTRRAALGWSSLVSRPVPASIRRAVISGTAGAMCGGVPEGLLGSSYYFLLEEAWFPSVHSLEDWSPCWSSDFAGDFVKDPEYPYYSASINYLDVTGRNGNGYTSLARQPVTYMSMMAGYSLYYTNNNNESG